MNRFKNELIIDSNSKFGYFYTIGDEFLTRKPPLEEINNLVKGYSAHMFPSHDPVGDRNYTV